MLDPTPTKQSKADALRAVAARAAAIGATPAWLRRSSKPLPAFEDKAVAAVLALTNLGSIQEVRAEGRTSRDDGLARFDDFHRVHPGFAVRFTAGRFAVHYDGIATELLNDPTSTPMYSAWVDAHARYPTAGALALIFPWPRIKTGVRKAINLCVMHNHADGLGRHTDKPYRGFRITVPVPGSVLHIEPLPSFLSAREE